MSAEKTDIWMPLYIGDYLAAVQHLSAEHSGAYLHLLMHQWKNGSLPADNEALRRIARIDGGDAWSIAWALLEDFFSFATGAPVQKRLEEIREEWVRKKAKSKAKSAKAAAAMWDKRRKDATSSAPSSAPSNAKAMPESCPSPSPSPSHKGKDIKTLVRADDLERVYQAYPRKVARGKAIPAIEKAVLHLGHGEDMPAMSVPEACEFLHRRVMAFARSPAGQAGDFTPHAATWFNSKRYLDDESEWMRGNDGTHRQRSGGSGSGSGHRPGLVERQLEELRKAGVNSADRGAEDRSRQDGGAARGRDGGGATRVVLEGSRG